MLLQVINGSLGTEPVEGGLLITYLLCYGLYIIYFIDYQEAYEPCGQTTCVLTLFSLLY